MTWLIHLLILVICPPSLFQVHQDQSQVEILTKRQAGYNDNIPGASRKDLDDEIRNMKKKNDKDIEMEKKGDEGKIVQTNTNIFHKLKNRQDYYLRK